jgi:hypothetical protein
LDDLERTGNLIEAGFWIIFGVVVTLGLGRQARRLTPFSLVSGMVVILFGLSDLVEARTGAWWRPWWLLLWKAVCLTGMVVCFLKYRQARTVPAPPRVNSSQAPSSSM